MANQTTENKQKVGRSYLRNIMNASKEVTKANRLPLKTINVQATANASSTSNQNCAKESSSRELRQLSPNRSTGRTADVADGESLSASQINRQIAELRLSKGPLRLTDLIDDCFAHVLGKLCFQDLVNVAGTCVRLQSFVCSFFTDHTRDHEVYIDCNQYPRYTLTMCSNIWPHEFNGADLPTFLCRFRKVIKKLTIMNLFPLDADHKRLQNDVEIERLIAKTFAKKPNLRELKFIRCGRLMLTKHDASLEFYVGKVTFDRCILGSSALNWANLFPNMQKLVIAECEATMARECIERPFENLKSFVLTVSNTHVNSWFNCSFEIHNVQRAIDANPNIQTLALCYWNEFAYDAKLLKYASERLPLLQTLHVRHLASTEFFSEGDIDFASVKKFTLSNDVVKPEKFQKNLASLTFPALRRFDLLGHYDVDCVTFLARHETIEKFVCHPHVQYKEQPTDFDIRAFGNVSPNLKTLYINGNLITSAGLLEFISGCTTVSLIKIRLLVFSPAICEQFRNDCMKLGWNVSYAHTNNIPKIVMKKA